MAAQVADSGRGSGDVAGLSHHIAHAQLAKGAQNIIVIKTMPGLAPAACAALDGMEIDGLVGTLAGDDTAFLAMKDINYAEHFEKEIESLL